MNNTEKNKKTYITPMIEVIEFDCVDDILAASGNLNSTNPTFENSTKAGSGVWGPN